MIASLRGEVTEKLIDHLIIEVGGVGYKVSISATDYDEVSLNKETKLYIHENIREDTYDLYGFTSVQSKNLFELLISVKNVGPKVALTLLNIGTPDKVRSAIASGDIKLLTSAKGVGKRAAEQLIVELRDKVGLIASIDADEIVYRSGINPNDEALQALVALGYSEHDATNVLRSVDPKLPLDERVRVALKGPK